MFFFLMLGPFKILGPFAKMTKDIDDASRNALATRAVIFSALALADRGRFSSLSGIDKDNPRSIRFS